MAENYGLPYTGSKSRIAHWVVDNLPRGRVLIDAFAGGCAITHRALLSQKWQTIIANDINGKYPQLFFDAIHGRYRDERRWISREDFERLKSQDAFVACCWSFGNNLQGYMYSQAIEPYKRRCIMRSCLTTSSRCKSSCQRLREMCTKPFIGYEIHTTDASRLKTSSSKR